MESHQPTPSNSASNCLEPHCPGPPKALKAHGSSLLLERGDEIQQLRNELQLSQGKIKGYEILGHLFQESKQECAHYKTQNEELMKKIEQLTTSHLFVSPLMSDKSSYPQRTLVFGDTDASRNVPSALCNTEQQQAGPEKGFSLTEVGAKTPLTVHQGSKSGGSSGSSSPSFVQISESGLTSPASFSLTNKPPEQSSMSSAELVAQMSANADMTAEINQVTEQIKKLGQSGGSGSIPDLSADLIRAGVHVLKLQKQNRVQQVLMEKMSTEIAELKADKVDKQQFIQQLQKECQLLNGRIKQMEASRGKALQEAQTKILATAATDPEDNFAGPSSAEWVEVEKHQTTGAADELMEGASGSERVTATSLVEMELKRRIEKLSATITELVAVNRNWDEHCRDIETKNNQQMAAMQTQQAHLQKIVDEYEMSDQKRQQEFDGLLLSCKQQREAEEMAKEEALNQLHRERQLRTDADFKCMEFSRKNVELEAQLIELQNSQQVHPVSHPTHRGQPMTAKEQELSSQLVILQEQINVFKEDFDQERSDREATRSKMELLRRQLSDAHGQINVMSSKLARATADLKTTSSENEQWKLRFQKLTADLEALRRHGRPVTQMRTQQVVQPTVSQPRNLSEWQPHHVVQPAVSQPRNLSEWQPHHVVQPAVSQPRNYSEWQPQQAAIRQPSWSCTECTFKNSGTATICKMCGAVKFRGVYQTDVLVGGIPVAGPQEYSPYLPYAPLVSRSLETDQIDNKR